MKVTECRICKSTDLIEYLDLGEHPPSDAFVEWNEFDEKFYPLKVLFCPTCYLSQLSHVVAAAELYKNCYPYETGLNTQGVLHFRAMAMELSDRFLKPRDLVIDIGSNDGTLLHGFKQCGMTVCGVEPVTALAEKATVSTINDFFGELPARHIGKGKAKLVTATNVFAHVHDLHEMMKWIDYILADDGVFVIEAPYLTSMVRSLAFDTIYHEHLSYLSFAPLQYLFKQYGMSIFAFKHLEIHGGSLRYFITRQKKPTRLWDELGVADCGIDRLRQFATEVEAFGHNLFVLLTKLKLEGKSIVGVSAPAKGNTLLNYCNINSSTLDYITEKSPKKIGKFTPGTHIPVVPDSRLIEDQPDYAIILAWNWESQIKEALKDYKGTWIVPTPKGLSEFTKR